MKASDFSKFLTQYLTHYLPVQRNLSSNTIRSYRDTFKLLLIFCRDEKGFNIAKLNLAKLDKKVYRGLPSVADQYQRFFPIYLQPAPLRHSRFL